LNVIKGFVVNPLPPLTTVTDATPTGASTDCAVAPVPVPEIVAVGATVYPEPGLVMLTPVIFPWPVITAVAAAPVPGPEKEIVGATV
jgi:hypothetical protein